MAEEVNLPLPPTPKTSWTIPFLLVLSIFSLAISGYLFWQNQKLQQKLAATTTPSAVAVQSSSSPTIIPFSSPLPETPPADPTEGWKTYTNTNISATIKYPSEWSIKTDTNNKSVDFDTKTSSPKTVEGNQVNYFFNFQLEDPSNFRGWSNDISTTKLESILVNGMQFERYIAADMFYTLNYIYKNSEGKIFRFYLGPYTQTETLTVLDNTINLILATFRFTE